MPKFVYKYRSVTNYTLPMLEKSTIWMALPSSFNDPFDCKTAIFGKLAEKDAEDHFKQLRVASFILTVRRALKEKRTIFNMSRKNMKKFLRLAEKSKELEPVYKAVIERIDKLPFRMEFPQPKSFLKAIEQRLEKIGVLSLTSQPKNMLMWTHYTDNHQGFCLGFQRSPDSDLSNPKKCKPVNYVKEFPKINVDSLSFKTNYSLSKDKAITSVSLKLDEPNIQTVVFTKADVWAYEEEWRFINDSGGTEIPYPSPLRKVIFGLRCTQENRKNIIKAIERSNDRDVSFGEITTKTNSFELEIREFSR